MDDAQDVDTQLLRAIAEADRCRVSALYASAAEEAERAGDIDRTCFFLTQAWVFALEADDETAVLFEQRLARHGRV